MFTQSSGIIDEEDWAGLGVAWHVGACSIDLVWVGAESVTLKKVFYAEPSDSLGSSMLWYAENFFSSTYYVRWALIAFTNLVYLPMSIKLVPCCSWRSGRSNSRASSSLLGWPKRYEAPSWIKEFMPCIAVIIQVWSSNGWVGSLGCGSCFGLVISARIGDTYWAAWVILTRSHGSTCLGGIWLTLGDKRGAIWDV